RPNAGCGGATGGVAGGGGCAAAGGGWLVSVHGGGFLLLLIAHRPPRVPGGVAGGAGWFANARAGPGQQGRSGPTRAAGRREDIWMCGSSTPSGAQRPG